MPSFSQPYIFYILCWTECVQEGKSAFELVKDTEDRAALEVVCLCGTLVQQNI
jgi:hypothetical protein